MLNNIKTLTDNNLPQEIIGIFDSGMGGLTVVNAIKDLLPQQSLIYVGDTAHCPWGDKSIQQIKDYTLKLTDFLSKNHCKIIVVACNTASCVALKNLKEKFKNLQIFDVIDPTIEYLSGLDWFKYQNIGIIGTKQTIRSQEYQKRIKNLQDIFNINPALEIKALATPLLVNLIEEGLINHPATNLIIEQYLSDLNLADNSILILGCTHYPLIRENIKNYYTKVQKSITIIDSATLIAVRIKKFLMSNEYLITLNTQASKKNDFYCTENSGFFIEIAQRFFPNIDLKFLPLWE